MQRRNRDEHLVSVCLKRREKKGAKNPEQNMLLGLAKARRPALSADVESLRRRKKNISELRPVARNDNKNIEICVEPPAAGVAGATD